MSVGTIVPEEGPTFSFNWVIPDFFSRMENEVVLIDSPEFSFWGCNWKCSMHADENWDDDEVSKATIQFYLTRRRPISDNKTLCCTIWVKKSDGTAEDPSTDSRTLSKNRRWEPALQVAFFDLRLSGLVNRRSELVPSGTLTIGCSIQEIVAETSEPEPVDTLAGDLKNLLLSSEDSDAIVRVKGQDFPVHRAILGARTPVFRAMFRHETTEKASGVVVIEDFEPDTVRRFLEHVYSGQVEDMAPGNATDLYEVADKYQVESLKRKCLDCIRCDLSVETFCPAITLAMKYDLRELATLATDFFASNIKDIIESDMWSRFLDENFHEANELLIKAHRRK